MQSRLVSHLQDDPELLILLLLPPSCVNHHTWLMHCWGPSAGFRAHSTELHPQALGFIFNTVYHLLYPKYHFHM